jgi:AcrR family transcriptional regulator
MLNINSLNIYSTKSKINKGATRMKKREEQKAERRDAILEAALDLFVRKGYNATKISDIAASVNMSVGLLFHYFDSKEKLYEELVKIGLQGTQSIMELDTRNPIEFFEQAVRNIFMYLDDPYVCKMFVLMGQAVMNDAAPQAVKELLSQLKSIEASVPLIEAGQKQGVIREGNPMALSTAFWCSIQGIAEELALNPETPCPEPEWIVDMIRKTRGEFK